MRGWRRGHALCAAVWKPKLAAAAKCALRALYRPTAAPPHLALRGSVDDNCTSRAPTALLALCLLMPPFPSVLPLCLTTFPRSCLWCLRSSSGRIFSRSSQFFLRLLSLASSFACGGPRRAIFGQLFGGGVFLLHDSSRPARRTAKAWRLRPARGTAPRVSGSHRSVLHSGAAAAATRAAARGRRRSRRG